MKYGTVADRSEPLTTLYVPYMNDAGMTILKKPFLKGFRLHTDDSGILDPSLVDVCLGNTTAQLRNEESWINGVCKIKHQWEELLGTELFTGTNSSTETDMDDNVENDLTQYANLDALVEKTQGTNIHPGFYIIGAFGKFYAAPDPTPPPSPVPSDDDDDHKMRTRQKVIKVVNKKYSMSGISNVANLVSIIAVVAWVSATKRESIQVLNRHY